MNFELLKSVRFWQLFFVGVTAGLNDYVAHGNWVQALAIAFGIWFGGSVLVGTYDKGKVNAKKRS